MSMHDSHIIQDIALKENEVIAITGKLDPTTGVEVDPQSEVESEWWKVLKQRRSAEEDKVV
ncbi:hypothetical protein BDR03DRAFT_1015250 [Suillus americanus]|nr:hypothetical protein BDR03DRAFT_1015250 [Suillus americanus]